MSVYVSYTDESESHDQKSGQFLIAGYVADELKWPAFSKRWSEEVISSHPAIPYLHMVDIRSHKWRAKYGITRAQADEKVWKAVQIQSETDFITAYLTNISEQAYRKAVKVFEATEKPKKRVSKIDYLCFLGYSVSLIPKLASEHGDLQKVIFNISRKAIVSHHLQTDLYDAMLDELETLNPVIRKLFGQVVPLDMANHVPLQAADVLCWHLQRAYANPHAIEPDIDRNIEKLRTKGLYQLDIPDSALEILAQNIAERISEETANDGA